MSATYVVVGSGPAGCACAASLLRCDGDPATTVIVLERGPRLGATPRPAAPFPGPLRRAARGTRALRRRRGAAVRGLRVERHRRGRRRSALNAGGLFHDAAYWGGGWGGGAAWAPDTMRRCARRARRARGRAAAAVGGAAAFDAAAGFAVAPGAPVDREAWEVCAAGRGAAFAPRVAFAAGGARLGSARLLRATARGGRGGPRRGPRRLRRRRPRGGRRPRGRRDRRRGARRRRRQRRGGGGSSRRRARRGGGLRTTRPSPCPSSPRRRGAARPRRSPPARRSPRQRRRQRRRWPRGAARAARAGPPRAAPAYAGVAFGDGFQLSYVAAGLAGPAARSPARPARGASAARAPVRRGRARRRGRGRARRVARGAEPFDVGAVVAAVSRPDAGGGAPLSPRDAAALARGLDAAEDVADGLRAELRSAARWSPRTARSGAGAPPGLGLARAAGRRRRARRVPRDARRLALAPAGGAARGAALDAARRVRWDDGRVRSKTVLNELHGLQERLIDGLAAPELADQRAENARLRALLGDAVRVIGQLRGVDGDDAAAGDAEAKEAAAAAPRPFRAAELDDAVAVRSRAAVDDPRRTRRPYDVAQGGLGDCYLLSALCVLAERPGRVHRLFRTTEVNAAGIYGARLYLHGEKRLVLVDDALPARDGRPLFAASRTDGELWVSLYEKAFAKVYGSYAAIEAGSTAAVLETLTGADLQKLVGIVEEHASRGPGRPAGAAARLLKLRNPWANGVEWRGAWSDGSDEWSDDLRRTLGHDVAADGVFFMSVEDVANVFDEVAVCAVDDHAQYSHSPRLAFAAGGARAAALKVRPSRSGSFAVSIRQPGVRGAVARTPGAGMPAHLGTSGDAFEGATAAAWALEGGATYLVVVETYDAAAKGDGPLDGTFVCSTYGPARPRSRCSGPTRRRRPPRVLEETVTFDLEGADVARATLDADGRVVALAVVDPVVKVALPPGTSSLLLVRKLPAAKAYSVSYRRSARLRAARG
ncbi:calcium-dependent cysteine-type endopeptidase [Aureococcus anophagefferens]|nr:calcium-dependent cysteine-type endopeptidase [Aureococcus anophagefferens]